MAIHLSGYVNVLDAQHYYTRTQTTSVTQTIGLTGYPANVYSNLSVLNDMYNKEVKKVARKALAKTKANRQLVLPLELSSESVRPVRSHW